MDVEVFFEDSAFKHGAAKADILKALSGCLYDGLLVDEEHSPFPDKRVAVGFDTKGALIEVLYNETGENELTVFHAMLCREKFLKRLQ
jgi:hypothetical protein